MTHHHHHHYLGQHALLDLRQCDVSVLGDVARLRELALQAACVAGATVLFDYFHHFGGDSGVTGVILLAESHLSVHTWTEYACAAVDIFVCGAHVQLQAACDVWILGLNSPDYNIHIAHR